MHEHPTMLLLGSLSKGKFHLINGKTGKIKNRCPRGVGCCCRPQCPGFEVGVWGMILALQVGKDESSLRNARKSKNNPFFFPWKRKQLGGKAHTFVNL